MKFWGSPDLVAQLLTFLDVSSTLALANVLPLAQDLLQRKFIWGDLMRRSNIKRYPWKEARDKTQEEQSDGWMEQVKINKTEVAQLVNIAVLKMVKDPKLLVQELLDMICERFERIPWPDWGADDDYMTMSCSRHPSDHEVDREGFQLLELVEGIMGTSLQQIKELVEGYISDNSDNKFELALASRLSRQKEQLLSLTMVDAVFSSDRGLNATILQKTLKWDLEEISLGDMGEEGWSWFAKGMKRNKNRVETIYVSKQIIRKAKKDDLKTVWDATSEFGHWEIVGKLGLTDSDSDSDSDSEEGEDSEQDSLERDCSGSCADIREPWVCRYTDKRDADGKIVDCGWQRLEEIWDAGQK